MTPDTEASKTDSRNFRMNHADWAAFGAAIDAAHPDATTPRVRAQLIRQFIHWYMRRPGATLPDRPGKGSWSTPSK